MNDFQSLGAITDVTMPPGIATLDNKPIIITFLAMEKVFLLLYY